MVVSVLFIIGYWEMCSGPPSSTGTDVSDKAGDSRVCLIRGEWSQSCGTVVAVAAGGGSNKKEMVHVWARGEREQEHIDL